MDSKSVQPGATPGLSAIRDDFGNIFDPDRVEPGRAGPETCMSNNKNIFTNNFYVLNYFNPERTGEDK